MEQILSTVITNGNLILTLLIVGIALVLFILLIINFTSGESVVLGDLGQSDELESTLRRVLADSDGRPRARANNALEEYQIEQMSERVDKLESEVLEKDQTIAELNRRLTATGSGATVEGMVAIDADELREKIKQLEARLYEYEIIEDDIADLSKFKMQNEELKEEIEKLRAKLASLAPEAVNSKPDQHIEISRAERKGRDSHSDDVPEFEEASGADLVAEFEKVVNNQDKTGAGEPVIDAASSIDQSEFRLAQDVDYGEVLVSKMQEMNIKPDTKEEAEIFISDLRSLKLSEADMQALEAESGEYDGDNSNTEGDNAESDESA